MIRSSNGQGASVCAQASRCLLNNPRYDRIKWTLPDRQHRNESGVARDNRVLSDRRGVHALNYAISKVSTAYFQTGNFLGSRHDGGSDNSGRAAPFAVPLDVLVMDVRVTAASHVELSGIVLRCL